MKLAIYHRQGSFSDRWIAYCKRENISFKIVNCFDTDIIEQLKDCDALLWHHHHGVFMDKMVANKVLFALEQAKVLVFPTWNTAWHFDDKVAQKYLLEAVKAPLVLSYVFYDKEKALNWIEQVSFPKVWKLKGGAGSSNVKLVKSKSRAIKIIKKAFGKGFSSFNRKEHFRERLRKYKNGQNNLLDVFKGFGRLFIPTRFSKMYGREKGYIYFQEFIPNNNYDIRVIVIANKAFAIKRIVRNGDFRASGSGKIIYDQVEIPIKCIEIAFKVNDKINSQSIAFDFVFNSSNQPLIVELSYAFSVEAYDACPGYWDQDLNWHKEKFNPQEWMIKDVIEKIKEKRV